MKVMIDFNPLMLTVAKTSQAILMKSFEANAKLGKYSKDRCLVEHK